VEGWEVRLLLLKSIQKQMCKFEFTITFDEYPVFELI
jgi:hypothetical protein